VSRGSVYLNIFVRLITVICVLCWISLYSLVEFWSKHRPNRPDPSGGWVVYVKAPTTIVYVTNVEHMYLVILSIVIFVTTSLLILLKLYVQMHGAEKNR